MFSSGVNAQNQPVCHEILAQPGREHAVWHAAELYVYAGDFALQAFAAGDIKRHSAPAPVVDVQAQHGIGGHVGIRTHAFLLAVAHHGLPLGLAGVVLAQHYEAVQAVHG